MGGAAARQAHLKIAREKLQILRKKGKALSNWGRFLRLLVMGVKAQGKWSRWHERELKGLDVQEASSLSDVDIFTLQAKVRCLKPEALKLWSGEQISALTAVQIRALTPHQLQILMRSPFIEAEHIVRLTKALARQGHVQKLGELIHALHEDALRKEKLQIIAEVVLALPLGRLKDALTIVAKVSSHKQFEVFLKGLPFSVICELFSMDQKEIYDPRYQDLSFAIERDEFENNMAYQAIELEVAKIAEVLQLSALEPIVDVLRDLKGQLKKNHRSVTPRLRAILDNSCQVLQRLSAVIEVPSAMKQSLHDALSPCQRRGDIEQVIEGVSLFIQRLLEMRQDLLFQQRCLQEKNMGTSHFVDHWKQDYLSRAYDQVLSVGIDDLPKEKRDEYRWQLEESLNKARRDAAFLHDSFSWFTEKIRHSAQTGRFSVEFFKKVVEYHLYHPSTRILSSRQLEEILMLPGMLDLLALIELKLRVGKIKAALARKITQLQEN